MEGFAPADPLAPPVDARLPLASVLVGDHGRQAVAEFLSDHGFEVDHARPVQAVYRPGRSMVVRHRVAARRRDGGAAVLNVCTAVGSVESHDPAPGPSVAPAGVRRAGPLMTWAYPHDPALPMLAVAASGPAVREVLAGAGIAARAVHVEPLAYRPGRRAAFRYSALDDSGVRTLYGKVLRPARAERLARATKGLHRRRKVRLAAPLARQGELFLFAPQPGRSLRDLIVRGGSLPHPARLFDAGDALARACRPGALDPRPTAAVAARSHRRLVAQLVPELEAIARAIEAAAVDRLDDVLGAQSPVPVHGDLYDAQVFVADDHSIGLIDLDDVGLGWPLLEVGNLTAHLLALAFAVPAARDRAVAYRTLVHEGATRRLGVTTEVLAAAEAVCLLGLASGPFRVLEADWRRGVTRRVVAAAQLVGLDSDVRG